MTVLTIVLAVWGGLLVLGVLVGSALGFVARNTDDANDLELARGIERQHAAMLRVRERTVADENARRAQHRPGATAPGGDVAARPHAARGR